MKKKLEAALIKIAHKIIEQKGSVDIATLHADVNRLYEKLTILKFVEEQLGEMQPSLGDNKVADGFEGLANSVLDGNKQVPETNPHAGEDDLIVPGIETIKGMIEEMPEKETLEDILSEVLPEPTFVKAEPEILAPETEVKHKIEHVKLSLNDRLKTNSLSVGLNDRIAFVKHLFDGSTEDYNRVISQLSTIHSFDEAQSFVNTMVKPDYNNWEGKEAYETRFMQLIESNLN